MPDVVVQAICFRGGAGGDGDDQGLTAFENMFPNIGQSCRESDRRQVMAVEKCVVSDRSHGVGNIDLSLVTAALLRFRQQRPDKPVAG